MSLRELVCWPVRHPDGSLVYETTENLEPGCWVDRSSNRDYKRQLQESMGVSSPSFEPVVSAEESRARARTSDQGARERARSDAAFRKAVKREILYRLYGAGPKYWNR